MFTFWFQVKQGWKINLLSIWKIFIKFAINEFDKELQYESKKWEHNFDSLWVNSFFNIHSLFSFYNFGEMRRVLFGLRVMVSFITLVTSYKYFAIAETFFFMYLSFLEIETL